MNYQFLQFLKFIYFRHLQIKPCNNKFTFLKSPFGSIIVPYPYKFPL